MTSTLTTLMTDEEVFNTVEQYLAHHYHKLLGVNFVSADECWFYDSKDRLILDMLAQYSATGFGHGYKGELTHTFKNHVEEALDRERRFGCGMLPGSCANEIVAKGAKAVCEFTGMDKVVFMNTGAEAFDTTVKLIRKYAYLVHGIGENYGYILVCSNNFHGRTLGAISGSDTEQYREGFGPLLPGFVWVRFGDVESIERCIELQTLQLKKCIGVIIEPIQGEGGIHIPPYGYLRAVKEICRNHGILFCLDEVQTGFGRTGYKFAWEHDGMEARPDLMMLGKMLGGGVYPVSAVVGCDGIMSVFKPGDHGSTFGGTPLACAVASKVIEIFNNHPELIDHVRETGDYFIERLKRITKEINSVLFKEVRGRGLLVGVEFTGKLAPFFRDKLLKEGVLAGVAGHDRVLRFSPPLIITKREIDWALLRIERTLKLLSEQV